jgi:DNA repair exonuclease SbcCD ATPase subunit
VKIIRLQAENFKRLKAVTITPEGQIVQISGKNGQGKSSVLDSIWAALGGAEAIPKLPIRKGAEEAVIKLDLGEYLVTRKFKAREDGDFNTSLVIETPDGMRPKSPQTLLNELVGRFSLDPFQFVNMTPKGQFDALKVLVPGLDLADIKAKNEADYERRTAVNRKAKEAAASAAAIGAKDGKVQRVDVAEITAKLAGASEINDGIQRRAANRQKASESASTFRSTISANLAMVETYRKQIEEINLSIAGLLAANDEYDRQATELEVKLQTAEPLPDKVDTAKLAAELANANAINAEADKQECRDNLLAEAERYQAEAKALTEAMEAREEHKRAAIAAAKFPVPGLSLGDEEVLVDGVPFEQAAASQKIRTSVALAMAMNPNIRVIRIMEGSLLDEDALKIVADMAKDQDFQVWVETVSFDGTGPGVIIEDGHIKED